MDPWVIVIVLALVATTGALFLGLLSMSGGERVDNDFSEPLMWTRVGLQAFTALLLLAALFVRNG